MSHENASLAHGRSHIDSLTACGVFVSRRDPQNLPECCVPLAKKGRKCILQQKVSFGQLPDFFKRFERELTGVLLIKDRGAPETHVVEECETRLADQQDVFQTPPPLAFNFSYPNDDPRPAFNHYLCCPFNNSSTFLHNFNSRSLRRTPLINSLIDRTSPSPPASPSQTAFSVSFTKVKAWFKRLWLPLSSTLKRLYQLCRQRKKKPPITKISSRRVKAKWGHKFHWNPMLTCHNHDKHTAQTSFYISVSWTGKANIACRFDFCCRGNGHTGLKRDRWTFDHLTDACWLLVICPVNVCTQRLNSQLAFKVLASTFKSRWGNPLIMLLCMYFSRRGKTNAHINKPNFFLSFKFHFNSQSPWHTPIPLQRQFIDAYFYFFFYLILSNED